MSEETLEAEVERLRTAIADARKALNSGYSARALRILNEAELKK